MKEADEAKWASGLFECTVLHERFAPKRHRFVYRLFYFAFDLDDLGELDRRLGLFSVDRANVFSLHQSDYLPLTEAVHNPGPGASPLFSAGDRPSLKARALAFCSAHGVKPGREPRVKLVTLPRILGYRFNPVSFYFCSDAAGPLGAIAEVTNTFREVKPYFIPVAAGAGEGPIFRRRVSKHFYVSPFSPLDSTFDFALGAPGGKLAVRIDSHEDGRLVVHSTVAGTRISLTNARLARFLFKYPLLTLGISARIHWQAVRLWLKRVPSLTKAAGAESQSGLYRPHSSIARRPTA